MLSVTSLLDDDGTALGAGCNYRHPVLQAGEDSYQLSYEEPIILLSGHRCLLTSLGHPIAQAQAPA